MSTAHAAPSDLRTSNAFDLLRLIAAFAVAVGHAAYWTGDPVLWVSFSPSDPAAPMWFFDGVPLFFILSGMLVFRSAQRCLEAGRPIREYYGNRFLRVWPAVALYVVGAGALAYAVGAVADVHAVLAWAAPTALFLTGNGPGLGALEQANGALWTLPVEVSFYLIVPALAWAAGRIGLVALVLALYPVALAGIVLGALQDNGHLTGGALDYLGWTAVPYLWFFLLGMTLLLMGKKLPMRAGLALVCATAYLAWRVVFLNQGIEAIGSLPATALGAIPLAYLAAYLGMKLTWASRALHGRDLSYGLYVWHMFVISFFVYVASAWNVPMLGSPYIMLAIALCLAAASWRMVERPALARKRFSSREGPARLDTESTTSGVTAPHEPVAYLSATRQ